MEQRTTASPQFAPYATAVLLDALGGRHVRPAEAVRWVNSFRDILRKMRPISQDLAEKSPGDPPSPVMRAFGDTFLVLWTHEHQPEAAWLLTSFLVQRLFAGCIAHAIPVRGAVGCGWAVWDEETALGEAIADAAKCYEQADWLGVIAAPNCASMLDTMLAVEGEEYVSNWYMRHDVCLKATGQLSPVWALTWPQEFAVLGRGRQQGLALFQGWLGRIGRGADHERKYAATVSFYDEYMSHWADSSLLIRAMEGRPLA